MTTSASNNRVASSAQPDQPSTTAPASGRTQAGTELGTPPVGAPGGSATVPGAVGNESGGGPGGVGGGPRRLSLSVLPYFGKVEALKEDPPQPPPPSYPGRFVPHALRDGTELVARPQGAGGGSADPGRLALESEVVEKLRTIFDPEIPVNIYDLGLVYDIIIGPEKKVHILMTLTAPGCPVAGILPRAVERKVAEIPGVTGAAVELVWEPPWTKEMMSEAARLDLGLM